MKFNHFHGRHPFKHGRAPKMGVLLVNLGTPNAPTKTALKRYLAEFLSDRRVVEIPSLLWKIILHGVILQIRPKKSAAAYKRIWLNNGSPLMVHTKNLTDAIAAQLKTKIEGDLSLSFAMRYGQPSIKEKLLEFEQHGVERLLILPLYPQYSSATTGTVASAVFDVLKKWRWIPELHITSSYHDDLNYIEAVADSVRQQWMQTGQGDKLILSFHGMPKATLIAGDPYFCHCHKTARLIGQALGLQDKQWEMVFQSRFGKAQWLQPYAVTRFRDLPQEGIKNIIVVCPGFATDCLETLDEIAEEGKTEFIKAGGNRFIYVPALNTRKKQVDCLTQKILNCATGWIEMKQANDYPALEQSLALALKEGAEQ